MHEPPVEVRGGGAGDLNLAAPDIDGPARTSRIRKKSPGTFATGPVIRPARRIVRTLRRSLLASEDVDAERLHIAPPDSPLPASKAPDTSCDSDGDRERPRPGAALPPTIVSPVGVKTRSMVLELEKRKKADARRAEPVPERLGAITRAMRRRLLEAPQGGAATGIITKKKGPKKG